MKIGQMVQSRFVRQVATLMSGSATSQLVSLLAVPVISRLFDPTHFGIAAVFITAVTILSGVAPLRYFRAALLVKDNERAHKLIVLSSMALWSGCLLIYLILTLLVMVGLPPPLYGILEYWVWMIPVGMMLAGTGDIVSSCRMRDREYKTIALSDIGNSLLMAFSRLLFGIFGSSVWGLVFGYLTGLLGRLTILKRFTTKSTATYNKQTPWIELKSLAIEYKDFPLYNMPTGFIRSLSQNLPVLLMGVMFEPAVVGFYAMGERLVRQPLSLVGRPVRDVLLVKGSGIINNNKSIMPLFTKVTLWLFVSGLIPFGALFLYGEYIISHVLGDRWASAGSYIQVLAPWYFSVWVVMGVQSVLVVIRRQALMMWVQIVTFMIRCIVFAVAFASAFDARTTLIWFSTVNVLISICVLSITCYSIVYYQKYKQG